jgi:hypothetical protein
MVIKVQRKEWRIIMDKINFQSLPAHRVLHIP